ncbi:MAG: hypothetical protein M1450_00115 [Patescibacteria group bacterium]|nr:hypothetical protein [Patescibacteria group bacterium]
MTKSHELIGQRVDAVKSIFQTQDTHTGRFRLAVTEAEESVALEINGKKIVPIDIYGGAIDPALKADHVERVLAQKYKGDVGAITGSEKIVSGIRFSRGVKRAIQELAENEVDPKKELEEIIREAEQRGIKKIGAFGRLKSKVKAFQEMARNLRSRKS